MKRRFETNNYYFDFMKSFKKYINNVFHDNINHFQLNYNNKSILNYKLYETPVYEKPTCIINITDIQTLDNSDHTRFIGKSPNSLTVQAVCSNHTKKETILIDFKWVKINIDVKINLSNGADVITMYDNVLSYCPKNFYFYDYIMKALINIKGYVDNWKPDDNMENVILKYSKATKQNEIFAVYEDEPLIRLNSSTKNKTLDTNSIDLNYEVILKVPNIIGKHSINNQIINGIEIVINNSGFVNQPILIDMNNNIYSDNIRKLSRSYFLEPSDFDRKRDIFKLNKVVDKYILGKHLALYIIDDSTKSSPNMKFIELGMVKKYPNPNDFQSNSLNYIIDEEGEEIYEINLKDLGESIADFDFNEYSVLMLMVFH